jgi:hypothetical protein
MGLLIYSCLAIIVSSFGGCMVVMVVCLGGQTEARWGICTGVIQVSSIVFSMEPSNAYQTLTNVLPFASKPDSTTEAFPP